jgi:hypothetical protein
LIENLQLFSFGHLLRASDKWPNLSELFINVHDSRPVVQISNFSLQIHKINTLPSLLQFACFYRLLYVDSVISGLIDLREVSTHQRETSLLCFVFIRIQNIGEYKK